MNGKDEVNEEQSLAGHQSPASSRAESPYLALSQRSGASSIAEKLCNVELEDTPVSAVPVLNRDQRRLLAHLRNKFNLAEEVALKRVNSKPCKRTHKRRDPGPTKKPRTEDKEQGKPAGSSQAPPPTKDSGFKKPIISIAKAIKMRRMGIVGAKPFTVEEVSDIKNAICSLVRKQKSEMPPEFHGIQHKLGHLIATVADEESATWLANYGDEIAALCGHDLKVVDEANIPNTQVYKGSFAHSAEDSNEDILDTITSFTRRYALSTAQWRVVRRVNDGHVAILFLSVDDASSNYIRENEYLLPYRIGHARLHKVGPEEINPKTQQDIAADTQLKSTELMGEVRKEPSECESGPSGVKFIAKPPTVPKVTPASVPGPSGVKAKPPSAPKVTPASLPGQSGPNAKSSPALQKGSVKGKTANKPAADPKQAQPTLPETLRRSERAKSELNNAV